MTWFKRFLWIAVIAGAFALGTLFAPGQSATAQNSAQAVTDLESTFTRVYNAVSPSVVSITVDAQRGNQLIPFGSGSGFVIDSSGHIVTNFHVIEGADRIVVQFIDGLIARAEVAGLDRQSDIAVLRVDVPSERLVPVRFANSDALNIGEMTLALGSPFGQDWTLTTGVISALGRTIESDTQFDIGAVIQTDAAINPGNSGGPLLNMQGEVIGVNTQILSRQGSNSGIGFALPSNLVQRVIGELMTDGRVNYSYLGINGTDVNIDFIEAYTLPSDLSGVVVTTVANSGPASLGGLRDDTANAVDVITAINGIAISNFDDLVGYLSINTRPGDVVTMTVYREGRLVDLAITLGARLAS